MLTESVLLFDESRTDWSQAGHPRPIAATIWSKSPSDAPHAASASPLIVLSHGTGGATDDLVWLAERLSEAGYLVASVEHHGNSSKDQYLAEGFAFTWERPRDLSILIDHVIAQYNVDAERIGAAGFSLGGYTVAALLGARLDANVLAAVLGGYVPAPPLPEFPELIPALRTKYSDAELTALLPRGAASNADGRVRGGFLMAPAIGALIDVSSLGEVVAPVEVRWGDADDNAIPAENAEHYVNRMPAASGTSIGGSIGHYIFVGETDDPTGVRDRVARDAVDFFTRLFDAPQRSDREQKHEA